MSTITAFIANFSSHICQYLCSDIHDYELINGKIVYYTLTAENMGEPLASSAAIHDAKVQPVP